jgi:hypothetical protein
MTTAGNVGIGATNPMNILQVSHAAADGDNGIMIVNEGTTIGDATLLGAIGFDSADGDVPSSCLESSCYIAAYSAEAHHSTDKGGDLTFGCSLIDENHNVTSTEHMRIESNGKVAIGTAVPGSYKFKVLDGNSSLNFYQNGSDDLELRLIAKGNNANTSAIWFGDENDTIQAGVKYDATTQKLGIHADDNNVAITIDSSEKVGIGTASPDEILHIESDASTAFQIETTNGSVPRKWKLFSSGTDGNLYIRDETGTNTMMTFDVAGQVGIGTAFPSHDFSVASNDGGVISVLREDADNAITGSTALGKLYFGGDAPTDNTYQIGASIESISAAEWGTGGDSSDCPADILFKTCANGANTLNEVMRVANNGSVGIGVTTDPVDKLQLVSTSMSDDTSVAITITGEGGGNTNHASFGMRWDTAIGQPCAFLRMDTSDGVTHYIWATDDDDFHASSTIGHIGTTSGTKIGDMTSDERLKNISSDAFPYGLAEINKLKPIKFSMKADSSNQNRLGFGAQTTKPILPETVIDTKQCIDGYKWEVDGDGNQTKQVPKSSDTDTKLGMSYNQMIPVLVKAVQELSAKVTALENA